MELQIFNSEKFGKIRAFQSENGEPLFVAVDIARALGYEDPAKAIATHCKSADTTKRFVAHKNGIGGTNVQIINEPNVYRLIMRSKLKEAEYFQDWVFEDVLPTMRKQGGYIVTQESDTPEMIMARGYQVAMQTIENVKLHNKQLEFENQRQKKELIKAEPLIKLAEDCLSSTETMTASIISARLGFKSAIAFNNELKKLGIQYKIKGDDCWKLTSKYSCKGFTKTIPYTFPKRDGTIGTSNQMEWTESGFAFLREFLQKKSNQLITN
jgi:anti-repressor protein